MKKLLGSLLFLFAMIMSTEAHADDNNPPPAPPPQTVEQLTAEIARIRKENEDLKSKVKPPSGPDPKPDDNEDPLVVKARKDIEDKKRQGEDAKEIERSIRFNLGLDEFVKSNKSLLPEEIDGILQNASKEKYDSEAEQASAMKSAILTSFFSVQANVDSLMPSQKKALENWKSLTKKDREKRSADIYESVFEPAIDKIKSVKKAEEVSRSRAGLAPRNAGNTVYADRLVKLSQEQFGVKPRTR